MVEGLEIEEVEVEHEISQEMVQRVERVVVEVEHEQMDDLFGHL